MHPREYWNRKIIEWEKSAYKGVSKELSFIEKIATAFRRPIQKRREILKNVLKDLIKDKTVLELGCGSGDLCFELLNLGARKVIGLDISDVAISMARKKSAELGFMGRAEFHVADLKKEQVLPEADFVIGLGFIDYLDIQSLRRLFVKIKGKFIFSFPEKKINLINILQYLYLKSQGCNTFYKFDRKEFYDIPGINSKCQFFRIDKMTFITNFEIK